MSGLLWSDVVPRYDIVTEPVEITPSLSLEIARVQDINALVDSMGPEDFGEDERLPYWSCLWPAALALARYICEQPPLTEPIIEFGSGLGLVALSAAQAGLDVLATDYEPDALAFAEHNAELNGITLKTRRWDWRDATQLSGSFATIIAADVLYESRQVAPIASAIDRLLAPGGVALVADPGRPHHARFKARLRTLSLDVDTVRIDDVSIMRARRHGGSSGSSEDLPI